MKHLIAAISFLCIGEAFAWCSSPHRAAVSLYDAQGEARDLVKCKSVRCVERKFNRIERSVCRAIHRCEELGDMMEVSCLPNHTLTPESRQQLESDLQQAGEKLVELAKEALRDIRDAVVGRDDAPEEQDVEVDVEDE